MIRATSGKLLFPTEEMAQGVPIAVDESYVKITVFKPLIQVLRKNGILARMVV